MEVVNRGRGLETWITCTVCNALFGDRTYHHIFGTTKRKGWKKITHLRCLEYPVGVLLVVYVSVSSDFRCFRFLLVAIVNWIESIL